MGGGGGGAGWQSERGPFLVLPCLLLGLLQLRHCLAQLLLEARDAVGCPLCLTLSFPDHLLKETQKGKGRRLRESG